MISKFNIVINDFSGGLNTLDAPHSIADNQAYELVNFNVVGRGALQKRYGYDIVSQGTGIGGVRGILSFTTSASPSTKSLLIFHGGNVYTITPAATTWQLQGSYGVDDGTRVNGAVFKGLAFFGNGNAGNVVRKWDGTTLGILGGTPPLGSIFSNHPAMALMSGVRAGNTILYWSNVSAPEQWVTGTAGSLGILEGDGDPIMAIVFHNNQLIIFKQNAKYGLSPITNASLATTGFSTNEITDRSDGTLSGNSLGLHTDGIYFYGKQGFQKYGVIPRMPDRRALSNLSFVISPTLNLVKKQNAWKAAAKVWNNDYYCALPVFGSNNDVVFKYSTIFGSWTMYTGMPVSDFETFEDAQGVEDLYFSSEESPSLYKLNKSFYDAFDTVTGTGNPITARWRSKTFQPSRRGVTSLKNEFKRVLITGKITKGANVRFGINVDGANEFDTITDLDIQQDNSIGGGVGSVYTGLGYAGGGGTTTGETPMFKFIKEIHVPETINMGRSIYFTIDSGNDGEGIRIEEVLVEGEMLDSAVVL